MLAEELKANGEAEIVVQSVQEYEQTQETLAMLQMLA